jgi:hypothetical protein
MGTLLAPLDAVTIAAPDHLLIGMGTRTMGRLSGVSGRAGEWFSCPAATNRLA